MYNNHNPKFNLFHSNINLDISNKNNSSNLNKDRTNLSNNKTLESTIIPAFDKLF